MRGEGWVHVAVLVIGGAEIGGAAVSSAPSAATLAQRPTATTTTTATATATTTATALRDPRGTAFTFRVASAVDPGRGLPNAWVYVPRAFDPARRKLRVAIIFHGWQNCIRSYVSPHGDLCTRSRHTGYDIPVQAEDSGTTALVVVPQLAYEVKSSEPGPLGKRGGLRAFVTELVEQALVPVLGAHRYEDIERVALIASSGGWQALTPALVDGGVDVVKDVYLLDAFYNEEPLTSFFEARAAEIGSGFRFGLVYCWFISGSARVAEAFGARLLARIGDLGKGDLARFRSDRKEPQYDELRLPFVVIPTGLHHDAMVRKYLWQMLKAAEL